MTARLGYHVPGVRQANNAVGVLIGVVFGRDLVAACGAVYSLLLTRCLGLLCDAECFLKLQLVGSLDYDALERAYGDPITGCKIREKHDVLEVFSLHRIWHINVQHQRVVHEVGAVEVSSVQLVADKPVELVSGARRLALHLDPAVLLLLLFFGLFGGRSGLQNFTAKQRLDERAAGQAHGVVPIEHVDWLGCLGRIRLMLPHAKVVAHGEVSADLTKLVHLTLF